MQGLHGGSSQLMYGALKCALSNDGTVMGLVYDDAIACSAAGANVVEETLHWRHHICDC